MKFVYNQEKGPVTAIGKDFAPKAFDLVTDDEAEAIHQGKYPLLVEGKDEEFPYPYHTYTGDRKLK